MTPQVFTTLRFSSRIVAQTSACVILVLLVVASATATVSAPQANSMTTTSRSITLTRTPSPRATATPTRVAATRTSTVRPVAPRYVPGQPQVDANTVALYHFDSPHTLAIDATGSYTGTLHGNATIIDSGLYAGVLNLDGNGSYVRTGYLGSMPQGTIELFVDFQEACQQGWYFTILSAGGEFGSHQTALVIRQQVGLMFGIYSDGTWHWADSGINACRYLAGQSGPLWPYETWRFHHVAVTWGPRGMEIWVDGVFHGVGTDADDSIRPYKYKCNPQMQMGDMDGEPPNPLYPACRTPVMAPTMPAYPPGDYTGGLPAYNTLLIGCGTDGSCFKGRIDEVRISNIQRTFHWSVVPTVTPTPTQTPVPITGEYTVDANTLALYHLNAQSGWWLYDEVTQTWNAGLGNNATIVSGGRFASAALLDGNGDYIQIPKSIPSTIEMWINLSNLSDHFALFGGGNENGSDQIYLGINKWLGPFVVFTIYDSDFIPHTVNSGWRPIPGCWHHVAASLGSQGLQIWIDGTLRGVEAYYGGPTSSFTRVLVGCSNGLACVQGLIDEVRLSSVQRTFTRAGILASARSAGRVSTPFRNAKEGENFVYLPLIFWASAPSPSPTPTCPN